MIINIQKSSFETRFASKKIKDFCVDLLANFESIYLKNLTIKMPKIPILASKAIFEIKILINFSLYLFFKAVFWVKRRFYNEYHTFYYCSRCNASYYVFV
jgi:hypothetical protein